MYWLPVVLRKLDGIPRGLFCKTRGGGTAATTTRTLLTPFPPPPSFCCIIRMAIVMRDPREVVLSELRMRTKYAATNSGHLLQLEPFIRSRFEVGPSPLPMVCLVPLQCCTEGVLELRVKSRRRRCLTSHMIALQRSCTSLRLYQIGHSVLNHYAVVKTEHGWFDGSVCVCQHCRVTY